MTTPAQPTLRVLVVDDEPNIRDTLALCLEGIGCRAEKVATGAAALEALRLATFELALLRPPARRRERPRPRPPDAGGAARSRGGGYHRLCHRGHGGGGDQARGHLGGDFTVEKVEREHILRVLARTATQEEAARILGLDPSTLWRKRKKYGR